MKLKYNIGYLISIIVIIIGIALAFLKLDREKYFLLTGFICLSTFGIYYFIKEYSKNYGIKQWGRLLASLFILILIAVHFMLSHNIDYYLYAVLFFFAISLREEPKVINQRER
jgi:hypothetical protein